MYKIEATKCKNHPNKAVTHACCYKSCQSTLFFCDLCLGLHQQHQKNTMSVQKFYKTLAQSLQLQELKDEEAFKIHHDLLNSVQNYYQSCENKEKRILKEIMGHLELEKEWVLQAVYEEEKKEAERICRYFQSLKSKGLLQMRIKLSSEKGLERLNEDYQQYLHLTGRMGGGGLLGQCNAEPKSSQKIFSQYLDYGALFKKLIHYMKMKIAPQNSQKIDEAIISGQIKQGKDFPFKLES